MKTVFTKDEVLAKLKESLATRLAQAMEAMTGNTQRCLLVQDLESPSVDLLGWTAKYSAAPQVELRIFASPEDWKLMPSIGIGVKEIRVRENRAYRLVYVAKFSEAIYVLHAFEKKARKTPKPDIDLARTRFRALVNERKMK